MDAVCQLEAAGTIFLVIVELVIVFFLLPGIEGVAEKLKIVEGAVVALCKI